MKEKTTTIEEGVSQIPDGATIAIGNQKPMTLIREMIRQKRRDLVIYVMVGDYDVDMMCAAGCLREIHGMFVIPAAGPHFRASVQNGSVKMIDEGEAPLFMGIFGGAMNIPFVPLRGYQSDIVKIHPEYKRFSSPVSDEELLAVPAIVPDVAILHMPRSDSFGNVVAEDALVYDRSMAWWDKHISMASKTVIVSVEKIIDHTQVRENPDKTFLPFYDVDLVIEAERGGHPRELPGAYKADSEHLRLYAEACKSEERYLRYQNRYIFKVRDHDEYLQVVDADIKKGVLDA
jgi:glutaconate CoA-transferase, subunit A